MIVQPISFDLQPPSLFDQLFLKLPLLIVIGIPYSRESLLHTTLGPTLSQQAHMT